MCVEVYKYKHMSQDRAPGTRCRLVSPRESLEASGDLRSRDDLRYRSLLAISTMDSSPIMVDMLNSTQGEKQDW
jgi:hypothetical protein